MNAYKTLLPALTIFSFFLLWELTCQLHWVSPVLLSAPSNILVTGVRLSQDAGFQHDVAFTLGVYCVSLLLAVVFGTLIGLLIGYSVVLYRILNPFIVVINSLPKIVLMPLLVLWMGIGAWTNILLGALMAGFPIIIGAYTGLRRMEKDYLRLAQSFGATPGFVFRSILLPGTAPYIVSGLRVGVNYVLRLKYFDLKFPIYSQNT